AILLIAVNFVREQRWPIFVLLLWVLLLAFLGLTPNIQRQREDLLFIFKQVAVYVVVFSVFFGASAIHNERKSRRILAVLSKAITRRHYIAGLLSCITFAATLNCFAMGMTGTWVLGQIGFQPGRLWFFMMALLAACLLGAAIAVFFSVLLNPLLATAATAALVAIPFALAQLLGPSWGYTVPVYSLVQAFLTFSINQEPIIGWSVVLLGFAEAIIAWLAASWLFEWKDVAVAIE